MKSRLNVVMVRWAIAGMVLGVVAGPMVTAPARGRGPSGGPSVPASPAGAAPAQLADASYVAKVVAPLWERGQGARVLIDEGHNNFHTASGRYKPFADLLRADGLRVSASTGAIGADGLAEAEVLVIAGALGAARPSDEGADRDAFSADEVAAVRAWVEGGGSLLLVADHPPFAGAASGLARSLGVELSGRWAVDPQNADEETKNPTFLWFSERNGLLGEHAIIRGRDRGERVQRVVAFTGQAVRGPTGSVALLKLSGTVRHAASSKEIPVVLRSPGAAPVEGGPDHWPALGVAMELGKGRVVVLGEAAMLTAQRVDAPTGPVRMGLSRPDLDNPQFATNLVRWLARGLDPGEGR